MLAHGLTAAPAGPEDLICDEHGLDPELLIFDALTFTLTTGDAEWPPSAVETIEGSG